METWQIILAIIIVGLSIIMPIYYSKQKKRTDKEKESEVIERMQIREYGRKINDETRNKNKDL
jgi:hypothetical protein|tara:strand:+ start:6 stop:194 length:189 start_codon:yes stop_codon:yes gene_type:complete